MVWSMTDRDLPRELAELLMALDRADADAVAVCAGLDAAGGVWRAAPESWSVSECLDHLAIANHVYVGAMRPAALGARTRGRLRRGPARPGVIGRLFLAWMEPPVRPRLKKKAPASIRPRSAPALAEALARFRSSQEEVRAFVREIADLDLAHVTFANPFVTGIRFSLATGLQVIAAHERRHLWQAWNVRKALDAAASRAAA
jgi:hypothetical protein